MAKTESTKQLEELLRCQFNSRNNFYVFECTIGWYGEEIVDCIMYNCQREIYCYEIKQSKSDFHSKAKLTFIGNRNYYVMPYELYLQVKHEIPIEIGVYVSIKTINTRDFSQDEWNEYNLKRQNGIYENGFDELICIKKCYKRQELKADKEVILSSMLRSMQRDRYRSLERVEE